MRIIRDNQGRFVNVLDSEYWFKKGNIPPFKGKTMPQEIRTKISNGQKGQHHSPQTEFKKGFYQGYGFKKGCISTNKGIPMSEEQKQKIRVSCKGRKSNSGSFKRGIINYRNSKGINRYEIKLMNLLNRLQSNQWKYVGDGKLWLGYPPINPDFVHINKNIAIEVFDDYFKIKNYKSVDNYIKQRTILLNKIGWDLITIPNNEIREEVVSHLVGLVI